MLVRVFLFAVSRSINLATVSRAETSECARISDLASARARWAAARGWMLLRAAARCIAVASLLAMLDGSAHAGGALEARKLPMKFSWVACKPNCRGWVSAVGVVTANTQEISMNSRAADSSVARPSCWIPAAVRSTTRSRLDGAGAISGC